MNVSINTTHLSTAHDSGLLSEDSILFIIIGALLCFICILAIVFCIYCRHHHNNLQKDKHAITMFGIQSFKHRKKVPKDIADAVKTNNDKSEGDEELSPKSTTTMQPKSIPKPDPQIKPNPKTESENMEQIISNKMDRLFTQIPNRNRSNTAPDAYAHKHAHTTQEQYINNVGYVMKPQPQPQYAHMHYASANNYNQNNYALYQQQMQQRNRAMTQQRYMQNMNTNMNMNAHRMQTQTAAPQPMNNHSSHEEEHTHKSSSDSHHTHTREYSDDEMHEQGKTTLHGVDTMRDIHHFIAVDVKKEKKGDGIEELDETELQHESSSDSHHTHTKEYSEHEIVEKGTLHGDNTMREIHHFIKHDLQNELQGISENEAELNQYQD